MAEALASGLPVIAPDCPPVNEFVEAGVNGALVEVAAYFERADHYYWPMSVCSPAAIANAMQFYIDHRDEIPALKRRARQYSLAHLDWRNNARDISEKIASVPSRRSDIDQRLIGLAVDFERAKYRSLAKGQSILKLKSFLEKLGIGTVYRAARNVAKKSAGVRH